MEMGGAKGDPKSVELWEELDPGAEAEVEQGEVWEGEGEWEDGCREMGCREGG